MQPKDKIKWFYSGGFLSNREDGNGFSQRHVFSYWWEEGKLQYHGAQYDDITNIEVEYATNGLDDTIATIIRSNEQSFKLFISGENEKDKLFVEALKAQWKRLNPDAYEKAYPEVAPTSETEVKQESALQETEKQNSQ